MGSPVDRGDIPSPGPSGADRESRAGESADGVERGASRPGGDADTEVHLAGPIEDDTKICAVDEETIARARALAATTVPLHGDGQQRAHR